MRVTDKGVVVEQNATIQILAYQHRPNGWGLEFPMNSVCVQSVFSGGEDLDAWFAQNEGCVFEGRIQTEGSYEIAGPTSHVGYIQEWYEVHQSGECDCV